MTRFISIFAMACAGAAVASAMALWRKNQREAKAFKEQAIHRWEDDGGQVPPRANPAAND